MQLEGVTGAPYKHPEIRRKMPAPHRRDRIDLGGGPAAVKRHWKQTNVGDVRAGDVVADFGKVSHRVGYADPNNEHSWLFKLTNVFNVAREYPSYTSVLAYVPVKTEQ